jgi:hypothetical protein
VEKPPPGSHQKEKVMQPFLTQYQSAKLSDEQIIDNFVVRTKEFERVMADIRTTEKGSSFQHYVFVGRRGSGKSTLLRRIQAEVCTNPELKEKFIVANLSEEQAGIYKLYDLWDYVMRDLRNIGFELPEIDWQEYQDDLKEYTKVLYRAIHEFLQKEDQRLILLVDNIDRIFKNIGKDGNLLREQLMNFNDVRIIGASTIMAEDFWRYDMPFYQFFSIKRLEPLSMEEIKMLLEHWAKANNNPEIAKLAQKHTGKIQAVRMLTDGLPRTMQLFVDMLIHRDDQQGFDYLRRIIDNATPIYQERLSQLSHQQQKIVAELSFFWEAASVEQLVPVCKMTGKNISAQMSQLVKARIVEKVMRSSKNNLYRIEDRGFGFWMLLTQGSSMQKDSSSDLMAFLENFYSFVEDDTQKEQPRIHYQYASRFAKGFEANEEAAIYYKDERSKALFSPNDMWDDAQEEAVVIYHHNGAADKAILKIEEALEFCSDELSLKVIRNILYLWAGEMDKFSQEAGQLIIDCFLDRPELLQQYIMELLAHRQVNLVGQILKDYPPSMSRNAWLLPIGFALQSQQNPNGQELLSMPPELQQVVSDIVAKVKERQEFYYGK